ncbi:hypothetical protein [Streptomyces sp. NPDC049813]|uniref:hypothetical protein n=1 Tax=Streptomyces sp. NPDC049813 TaxID=3365597 RepID=UPI00378BCEE7
MSPTSAPATELDRPGPRQRAERPPVRGGAVHGGPPEPPDAVQVWAWSQSATLFGYGPASSAFL